MPVVAQAFYRVVGMNIGKSSRILMSTKVQGWNHISIGDHTYVNSYCHLDGRGRLTIGNYVNISNYSVIISAGHDMKSETFAYRTGEVCIDDLCWIGSRAMILNRFHLAPGAVLSAGSVFKCESFGGGLVWQRRRHRRPLSWTTGRMCDLDRCAGLRRAEGVPAGARRGLRRRGGRPAHHGTDGANGTIRRESKLPCRLSHRSRPGTFFAHRLASLYLPVIPYSSA